MGAMVQVQLKCDDYPCEAICTIMAPIKVLDMVISDQHLLYADMFEAEIPEGWWVGIRDVNFYGPTNKKFRCACPSHVKQLCGW